MAVKKKKKAIKVPQIIKVASKSLSYISTPLAAKFALNLFDKPMKFVMPKREWEMERQAKQYDILLPKCCKSIHVYEYGEGHKNVLLIHGWNGRGTQLVTIANALKEKGYKIISFDAPGHGKSPNNRSIMTNFIEAAFELEKIYKTFDVVVGHSLGGMSAINAVSRGLNCKQLISISAGDVIDDVISEFTQVLGMNNKVAPVLKEAFENKYQERVENYTVSNQLKKIEQPVLIIHDKFDKEVPFYAGESLAKNINKGSFFFTEHLGHQKILGDEKVIQQILAFCTS